jgi:hypothetical protein
MAQHVYITYTTHTKHIADHISSEIFANSRVQLLGNNISDIELFALAKRSTTEYFYVINSDTFTPINTFDFSFKPCREESEYIHRWVDSSVSLYNKEQVLGAVHGKVKLKLFNKVYNTGPPDIIFISYDESYADSHYRALVERFPTAKHVHGIKGILSAHVHAANISSTAMFYVVDADAVIEPTFDFTFVPPDTNTVYVWNSRNPVNDLVYGYGGVKLFPTTQLIVYSGNPVDFTTSVAEKFVVVNEVSNITKFNTDSFAAWRSGFREAAKLASCVIENQNDDETSARLNVWCTTGKDREFGSFTISGALAGRAFGIVHKNQPDMIGLINNYKWLAEQFNTAYQVTSRLEY